MQHLPSGEVSIVAVSQARQKFLNLISLFFWCCPVTVILWSDQGLFVTVWGWGQTHARTHHVLSLALCTRPPFVCVTSSCFNSENIAPSAGKQRVISHWNAAAPLLHKQQHKMCRVPRCALCVCVLACLRVCLCKTTCRWWCALIQSVATCGNCCSATAETGDSYIRDLLLLCTKLQVAGVFWPRLPWSTTFRRSIPSLVGWMDFE